MPTLAPPPAPSLSAASSRAASAPPDFSTVPFHGRTLAEYAQCFALDVAALRGRDVLDVAGGASSFTAEACARRIDAVAVDPLYGATLEELETRANADIEQFVATSRAAGRTTAGRWPSFPAAEGESRLAAERFLADYAVHFAHGRYVSGGLPRLPFFDGTFDLVLCAQLLFVGGPPFDFDWHLAACRELVRVSASEVRLHPLSGSDGRVFARLAALRRELKAGGIATEVRSVNAGIGLGADSMLVLTSRAP
jgi:hypothetical protein